MGYTTSFYGEVLVDPPLNKSEILFLNKLSNTRRMERHKGPYFVDGGGDFGQAQEPDITSYNTPPKGQPSLWVHWDASADGKRITWNGSEKFYDADAWMAYIIDHFLKPDCVMKYYDPEQYNKYNFQEHLVNGAIVAKGESTGDVWMINVYNNEVSTVQGNWEPDISLDQFNDQDEFDEAYYDAWESAGDEDVKWIDSSIEIIKSTYPTESELLAVIEKHKLNADLDGVVKEKTANKINKKITNAMSKLTLDQAEKTTGGKPQTSKNSTPNKL